MAGGTIRMRRTIASTATSGEIAGTVRSAGEGTVAGGAAFDADRHGLTPMPDAEFVSLTGTSLEDLLRAFVVLIELAPGRRTAPARRRARE